MRKATDVLNVIQDRGRRGLPLDDVYRQLYNPTLYLQAYGRIYHNDGAMTKGVTAETVDGMSMAKIQATIEALRFERYQWTPVRRTYIPKKNGKTRPLGIPTWSDKLLQEVMRSILEAYYEPQFSDRSHGFRPDRGCHTALTEVQRVWYGTKWFIEGDIKGCFDNISHKILMSILRERIYDNRFLRLIENLLKAGYLEEWDYRPTTSGTPQGGIISPILSNIYLDRLDKFVEKTLITEYTRGERRKTNPEWRKLYTRSKYLRKLGRTEEANELRKQYQSLPSLVPDDPDYRRLRYVRYADDFLLGFAGPASEAEEIKARLAAFLLDNLHLEMSAEKTLITHARTESARFLGYEITNQHEDTRLDERQRRTLNGTMALKVPKDVVDARCKLFMKMGKPMHRPELETDDDFSIVYKYQSEYRGLVQYYLLAQNVAILTKLHWVMETSLLKTLAHKHKCHVSEMSRKYRNSIQDDHGSVRCIMVTIEREGKKPLITYFGGISLRRNQKAILKDIPTYRYEPRTVEIVKRLLADKCEICGATDRIEVHHIRKLADLNGKDGRQKPLWKRIMSARRRKTLVVCHDCHMDIQFGRPSKATSLE